MAIISNLTIIVRSTDVPANLLWGKKYNKNKVSIKLSELSEWDLIFPKSISSKYHKNLHKLIKFKSSTEIIIFHKSA